MYWIHVNEFSNSWMPIIAGYPLSVAKVGYRLTQQLLKLIEFWRTYISMTSCFMSVPVAVMKTMKKHQLISYLHGRDFGNFCLCYTSLLRTLIVFYFIYLVFYKSFSMPGEIIRLCKLSIYLLFIWIEWKYIYRRT